MATHTLAWLCVLCTVLLVPVRVLSLEVTVNVGTTVSESGVTTLQRELQGLTAYGGLPNTTWIEGSGATIIGLALSSTQQFYLPDKPPNGASWTIGAIEAHYAQPDVIASLKRIPLADELRRLQAAGVLPHIYIVSIVPGQALGPNCTHVSDDCVPTNATIWGIAAREFLKIMQQVYPAITRAHLLNEPNAHWWKIDHPGTDVPYNGSDYAAFFNEAAAAIHADMPQLALGGPVTWCPPSGSSAVPSENQFFDYAGSLIDTVQQGQIDYIDFHSYGDDADYLLSEVFLVKGYSKAQMARSGNRGGRAAVARRAQSRPGFPWLRSAVTENSVQFFSAQEWLQREYHFQHRTMLLAAVWLRFAANPDKVYARHIFNYKDPGDGYERVEGTGPDSGPMSVTPEKQMLQMFKPMAGGTRVLVNVSGCMVSPCDDMLVEAVLTNSSTPCSATTTAGKSLLVAVLNQGTAAQSIALASGGVTAGWQCVSATGTVLDGTSMRPIPSVPLPGAGSFESPPRSLTVIKYQYCTAATTASVARVEREGPTSVAALAPAAELLREELFCDAFMQQIPASASGTPTRELSCSVALPPASGDATPLPWRIRAAFKGLCNATAWTATVHDPDGCMCSEGASTIVPLGVPGSYTDVAVGCTPTKSQQRQCTAQVSVTSSAAGHDQLRGSTSPAAGTATRDGAQAGTTPCWLKALAIVRQSLSQAQEA